MDHRSARNVPLQAFRTAFAAGGAITVAAEHQSDNGKPAGRHVAVYKDGRLIGLVTWPDLVSVMAEAGGWVFSPSSAVDFETGELLPTVDEVGQGLRRKLTARQGRLESEITDIVDRLGDGGSGRL
jgi:hypothetical protein